MVYFPAEHILTTDSQQISQKRIMQCLNGCWQIFSQHHPPQQGNSRSVSARVSVFRLPAWAGWGPRVTILATWKVLLALQPCLRRGFTGSQWSSKSRGRDRYWWVCTRWLWSAVRACQILMHLIHVLLSCSWARVFCSGVDGDTDYISVLLVRKAGSDI